MSEPRFDRDINDGCGGAPADGKERLDVPPELKAIEAELATLVPRGDRLQRDRLLFLAGQASVRGAMGRQHSGVLRWVWPASFAGMTTIAAALLVLLVRAEPQVVERIVYLPVQPSPDASADQGRVMETGVAESVTPRQHEDEERAEARETSHGRGVPSTSLTTTHLSFRGGLPAAGPQFRLFDHLFAEVPHARMSRKMSPRGPEHQADRRVLSRQLLDELLKESASKSTDSPADQPAFQNPGEES